MRGIYNERRWVAGDGPEEPEFNPTTDRHQGRKKAGDPLGIRYRLDLDVPRGQVRRSRQRAAVHERSSLRVQPTVV